MYIKQVCAPEGGGIFFFFFYILQKVTAVGLVNWTSLSHKGKRNASSFS